MKITIIKNLKLNFIWLAIFFSWFSPSLAQGTNLSLNQYLHQVQQGNKGIAGAALTSQGACLRAVEGKLLTAPRFFAEGQYINNTYDPDWSPLSGYGNSLQSYQVGISQNTPYGLQGKVYYSYQRQSINGIPPYFSSTNLTASSPVLELSVPLARNFGGKETRASTQLITSQARLTQFSEQFRLKLLLAQAESTYWRLAIARKIVDLQHDNLQRSLKLQNWVCSRVQSRLAEESDALQAQAAVQARDLDVQAAINDERLAERAFNTLRGSCQEGVCEHLCSYQGPLDIKPLACPAPREDVAAAHQEELLAIANAQLGIEKNKPNFDIYATYAFNGNNANPSAAIAESFTTAYPSSAIGVRLSVPLNIGQRAQAKCGYKKEIQGAKAKFAQKLFEDRRIWEDLSVKLSNAKQRYQLAYQLEQVQGKKLQTERERLLMGKTTTYQVLLFEQDYANAQLSRLVIQYDIYELMAQLKTYGDCA